MRHISIIGSGQAGLVLAHALIRKNYEVTLYSDKTADEWLNHSRPTGTAFLFDQSLQIERDIGIDHWSDTMFGGDGLFIEIAMPDGGLMPIVAGLPKKGGAVDQRLKYHRWLNDLEPAGGRLRIETVDVARAEQIAAASDLTILAVGKGELSRIVPRDAERSVYDRPLRNLAMGVVTNVKGWKAKTGGLTPVKYSKVQWGEIFWVPFTHKTAGESWSFIAEAIPGSPLDVFGSARSGPEIVETLRAAVREHAPWDDEMVGEMNYVEGDDLGWLAGAFPPTVRAAYGTLPSGALIIPVGDSSIAFDPVGGHGANNATQHAKFVADEIVDRNVLPFDEAWATSVWERYWNLRGGHAYRFNNIMLDPSPGWPELIVAASRDRRIADQIFATNIMIPRNFFPWIEDADATKRTLELVRANFEKAPGPKKMAAA